MPGIPGVAAGRAIEPSSSGVGACRRATAETGADAVLCGGPRTVGRVGRATSGRTGAGRWIAWPRSRAIVRGAVERIACAGAEGAGAAAGPAASAGDRGGVLCAVAAAARVGVAGDAAVAAGFGSVTVGDA